MHAWLGWLVTTAESFDYIGALIDVPHQFHPEICGNICRSFDYRRAAALLAARAPGGEGEKERRGEVEKWRSREVGEVGEVGEVEKRCGALLGTWTAKDAVNPWWPSPSGPWMESGSCVCSSGLL